MDSVIQLFQRMGTAKIVSLFATLMVLIFAFVMVISKYSAPEMVALYGNLELEDSNKIISELEARRIPYEVRASGSQILVPQDKALRLRMDMAKDGIPSKGSIVGYEIFDNSDAMNSSSFVQNVHLVRALEGELGRTISSFRNIKSARVHLVVPRRELFSREYQQPTSSVVLDLKGGGLGKSEVNAISHLVAAAVPGLDVSKVTVVDTSGRSLKLSEGEDDLSAAANTAQDYRTSYELKIKRTIEDLLERSVGPGSVEAQVSAEINFDRIVTNSEIYDPEGTVARSVQTIEETETNKEKNSSADSSIANNLPNAPQGGGEQSGETVQGSTKIDETTNFEISKTIRNHVRETGTIKRLSIAVLVDGTYITNPNTGEVTYYPRTDEELKKYEALIKSAVGYSEARKDLVEIANMQFKDNLPQEYEKESFLDWIKSELQDQLYGVIRTSVTGLIIIITILFFVRPFVNRVLDAATESVQAQVDAEVAIAHAEVKAAGIQAQSERRKRAVELGEEIEEEAEPIKIKKNQSFKSVNDIATQCPQETLMILKTWLNS
jgi:flagellar M-ring protein FliF